MLSKEKLVPTNRFYKIRPIKINKFVLNFIFIVALILLIIISWSSYNELKNLLVSNKWVTHTYEVIQTIDDGLYSLSEIDANQRAYLITDDKGFLKEVVAAKTKLKTSLNKLQYLVKDNPEQRGRVANFIKLVDERTALLAQVVDIKLGEKLQTNDGIILFSRSNAVALQVKGLGQEIKSVELTLLRERNNQMNNDTLLSTNLIVLGSMFSITFLIIPFIMANLELINRQIIEHKIKDTKSYLRQIIESTNEMIAAVDKKNRFQIFNEAYKEKFNTLFGKTLMVGMTLEEAFSETAESSKELSKIWLESLEYHRVVKNLEYDDGSKNYIYELSSWEIKNEKNEPQGIVHTIQDVTNRLEEDAKLHESYKKLEESIIELQDKNQQISLLVDMSDIMLASNSQDELSSVMSKFAQQLLDFSSGYLYIMHPSRNYLEIACQWGKPTRQENIFTPDQCWALRLGRNHNMNNQRKELLCEHINLNEESENTKLCVPLMAQNDIYGLLYIETASKEFILSADQHLIITAFAELTALALANVRLRENLRYQSIRDPLTGLYNRRYLEDALFKNLHQSDNNKLPFAIVMLDLDHFKKINDTYGHDAGDAVLKEVGQILNSAIRTGDVVSRYGGEEFILLFPATDGENAKKRTEEIRQNIAKIQVKYGAQHIGPVSVSCGISLYPQDGKETESLIDKADKALYWAKRHGRNQVVNFSELTPV